MDIKTYNQSGKAGGTTSVSEKLFGAKMNADLVWQVATSQMSNKRQVLAHAKTRAEVRGGGKKPWRQKGTGRARQGTTRAPQWAGGGVVFGPHPRSYGFKVPNKVVKLAMRSALSAKLADTQASIRSRYNARAGCSDIPANSSTATAVSTRRTAARTISLVRRSDRGEPDGTQYSATEIVSAR